MMKNTLISSGQWKAQWLGVLLGDRPALMPEFIAHGIIEHQVCEAPDDVGRLKTHIIDRLGGMARFARTARQVMRTGQPAVIWP